MPRTVKIDFRDIASSPIVQFSGKATMLMKVNPSGNITTYPIVLPYDGNEANFRIDYFNALNKLQEENKLPELKQFNYTQINGYDEQLLTSEELYDLLKASLDCYTTAVDMEAKLENVPKFYRPILRIMGDRRNAGVFMFVFISVIINLIVLAKFILWLFQNI